VTEHLTARVPEALRDTDGVSLDAMFAEEGITLLRELPRAGTPAGYVDLLVEDTSAPAHIRGTVVGPIYDEFNDSMTPRTLSFDRWEPWDGPTKGRGEPEPPAAGRYTDAPLTDAELEEFRAWRAAQAAAKG
jgi:hypothetical protein